ncbi:hypothetical protein ACEPPN_009043 [Leptodophora sp. 'Broadleaf-Isolate-01']
MFIAASQLQLHLRWWTWPASFISLIIVYLLSVAIYRLYFHPLSKFPGPKSAAISDFWLCSRWIGGFWPREIEAAHAKYGYVVRIAPNDLSFSGVGSLKDIYSNFDVNSNHQFIKYSKFYRQSDTGPSIGMESDPVKHQEVRKMLAPGFSAPTLKAQMPLVIKYVDQLVDRWVPLNMRSNLLAVKGKSHPWIDVLRNSGPQVALGYVLRRQHPVLVSILTKLLVNEKARRSRATYVSMTRAMAAKRLADKSAGRVDLFAHLISGKGEDTTLDFLAAQGSTLIAAGSETGATFLSAMTYYLISNSDMLDTVKTEVRQAYGSDAEIDGENLKKLIYLNAVIEEGLRIFPPASFGLPRVCPRAEIDGHWVPKGTVISSANHVTVQNLAYFFLPDEFHPERWLPSDHPLYDPRFAGDVKEASKPFSLGPRWCVGANLAYQEIRLVLAKLAWNFDWKFGAGMGKTNKFNDRDHAGLADGTAAATEHLPRYFAKTGHVDADPKKTKKNGAGKGGWGVDGEEVQDEGFNLANARRRSNSSSYTAGLKDFKTKFEHVEQDPVFEEDIHGAGDDEELPSARRVNTESSDGSIDEEDKAKSV